MLAYNILKLEEAKMTEDQAEEDAKKEEDLDREIEQITPRRRTKLRQELESALSKDCATSAKGVMLLNLDRQERYSFDSYADAMEFMKGKRGRWYIAGSGTGRSGSR